MRGPDSRGSRLWGHHDCGGIQIVGVTRLGAWTNFGDPDCGCIQIRVRGMDRLWGI